MWADWIWSAYIWIYEDFLNMAICNSKQILEIQCSNYWKALPNQQLPWNSYSNVFYSDGAASSWTSGRNLCSLSDWKTAASSKAVDRGLLNQLQAMWHCAFLIHSQWTSRLPTLWKGCKLHFIVANPVMNRALCLFLAGAHFLFSFFFFLDSQLTWRSKVAPMHFIKVW